MSSIDVSHLSADLPQEDNEFAELVYTTQKSNKRVAGMQVHDGPSQMVTVGDTTTLVLHRSQPAHSLNLRVYSDILLRSLQCSFRETTVPRDVLFGDLEPNTIAYRYLNQLCPDEPEMVLTLADVKMAYTSSDTKRYLVPTLQRVRDDQVVKAYLQRPISAENMTLYEYLHRYTLLRVVAVIPEVPTKIFWSA